MRAIPLPVLVACLIPGLSVPLHCAEGPKVVDIPARLDPNKPRVPDGNTVVLWRFDKPGFGGSSVWKNVGKTTGKPKVIPGGKFGGALELSGGEDSVFVQEIKGLAWYTSKKLPEKLSIGFWARFEKAPDANVCLLELASTDKTGSALRIDLQADCRLNVSSPGLEKGTSKNPVPAGRWFHVSVRGYDKWLEALCLETGLDVLVNGFVAVHMAVEGERYRFPPGTTRDAFRLGNSLDLRAGFIGKVDDFHVSNTKRYYLRLVEQPWIDPAGAARLRRTAEFFRMPGREVFHESFDQEGQLRTIQAANHMSEGGSEPDSPKEEEGETHERDGPGDELGDGELGEADEPEDIGGDLGVAGEPGEGEEPDRTGLAEMATELKTEMKVLKKLRASGEKSPRPRRIAAERGVKGKGLSVSGLPRGASVPLPEGMDLKDGGTIEFWLKPGDWDNRTPVPSHASGIVYRDTVRHILTLYGKEQDGKEHALVTMRAGCVIDSPRHTLEPYRWTHVVMFWGNGVRGAQPVVYLNGRAAGNVRSAGRAKGSGWTEFIPTRLALGDSAETAFDEVRMYDYPFYPIEAENAWAQYRGQPMKKLEPAVCHLNYRMSVGKMRVGVDVMLPQPERVTRAEIEFGSGAGKPATKGTIRDFRYGQGQTGLDVGELGEGKYECRGALLSENGKELARFARPFQRMKLPWLHNSLGYVDTPPPPFETITRRGNKVTAVGRKYRVGPSGHFTSILVKGKEILAAPVRLELEQEGKRVDLMASGAPRFGKVTPVEASWEGAVSGGDLEVRSAAKFEYDGMAKFTLGIAPKAGEVKVDRLSLVIPLKEKYTRLWHVLPPGGNFRFYERAGYLHMGDSRGLLWSSKIMHKYSRSSEWGPAGNLVHQVWLGGTIRGLCWFADNDRGWVPSTAQPMVAVVSEGETVTLNLHIISEPHVVSGPRQIVFGLVATPTKPLPKNHRLWNRGRTQEVGPIGGRLTSCDSFSGWQTHARGGNFAYFPKGYDWDFAKKASDRQRRGDLSKFPPRQALMMYHDRRYIYPHWETQYFDWEWGAGSYPPTKVDCLVWYMNEWFRRDIFDGIYIDDVYPIRDTNSVTGTAYRLPDGRVQPGNCYFGYREYLKRVYNVLCSHGKPPLITTHMTSTLEIPFHSFVTVIYDGENKGRFGNLRTTFMDAWPLDRLLTLNNPERTGLVTSIMMKESYATRNLDERKYAHMIWRTWRSAYAVWLLFDICGSGRHAGVGEVVRRYYGTDVRVHPFWRNQDLVKAEPLLEKPIEPKCMPSWGWGHKVMKRMLATNPLRATLYQKEDRALLVLANFVKTTVRGRVEIDFGALGLAKTAQAKLRAKDVDTWPPPEGVDPLNPKKVNVKPPDLDLTRDDGGDGEGLEVELVEASAKRGIQIKDGVVMLEVLPHNYRLIEFSWSGEADEAE